MELGKVNEREIISSPGENGETELGDYKTNKGSAGSSNRVTPLIKNKK